MGRDSDEPEVRTDQVPPLADLPYYLNATQAHAGTTGTWASHGSLHNPIGTQAGTTSSTPRANPPSTMTLACPAVELQPEDVPVTRVGLGAPPESDGQCLENPSSDN